MSNVIFIVVLIFSFKLSVIAKYVDIFDDENYKKFSESLTQNALVKIPDYKLQFPDIIRKHGYPIEVHEVETEDGYLLKLFRIQSKDGVVTGNNNKSVPILLVHGLMGSADNFIALGPQKSLGFLLANQQFDVWLLNVRGNFHSRKHIRYNPDVDFDYWKFSWHEVGVYDLPATIDYILRYTATDSLYYIGHSQGTTAFFVMGAERPEYNAKVRLMVALGPAALLRHFRYIYGQNLAKMYRFFHELSGKINQYELPPFVNLTLLRKTLYYSCSKQNPLRNFCLQLTSMVLNPGKGQLDRSIIPLILSAGPGGGSLRQLLHYAQLVATGDFRHYDFGFQNNFKMYGTEKPPPYQLNNIKVPIALFYGDGDDVCTEEDTRILATKLPNLAGVFQVPYKSYTHVGFIFAKDNDLILYNYIVKLLRKY